MALELVYTSAERGLRAGSSGFCTVAMTKGLPPGLVPRLEALGGYRPGPTGEGPVARSFWRIETAGGVAHVLAAVGPAPPDHTQRTNKIATYLVLAQEELDDAGPAWMLGQPGALRASWSGAPAWIEQAARAPAGGPAALRRADAWRSACGDAGWAGVLASAFLRDQGKPSHVIVPAGLDPLPLVDDAMHLLPPWARWRATFTTYFLQPVAGVACAWRFCVDGTPAADQARQSKGLVIDLSRPIGEAPDSRFARMARTGTDPEADAEAARQAKAREARAASKGRAAGAIELEPADDAEPPRARARAPVTPRGLPMDIELGEPLAPRPAGLAKPIIVAVVASVVTLAVIAIILATATTGGEGRQAEQAAPAAAPEQPATPPRIVRDPPVGSVDAPGAGGAPAPTHTPAVSGSGPGASAAPGDAARESSSGGSAASSAPATDTPAQSPPIVVPSLDKPVTLAAQPPAPEGPRAPVRLATVFGELQGPGDMGRIDAEWNPKPTAQAEIAVPEFMVAAGIVADSEGQVLVTGAQGSPLRLVAEPGRGAVLRAFLVRMPPKLGVASFDWLPGGQQSAPTGAEWLAAVHRRVLVRDHGPASEGVLFQPTRPAGGPVLRAKPANVAPVPDPTVWVRVTADGKVLAERAVVRGAKQSLALPTGGRAIDVELDAARPTMRLEYRAPDAVAAQKSLVDAKASLAAASAVLESIERACAADRPSESDLRTIAEALTDAEQARVLAKGGAKTAQGRLSAMTAAERRESLAAVRARIMADRATLQSDVDARAVLAEQAKAADTGLRVVVLGLDGYVFVDAPVRNEPGARGSR